jgi:hypothetical protein
VKQQWIVAAAIMEQIARNTPLKKGSRPPRDTDLMPRDIASEVIAERKAMRRGMDRGKLHALKPFLAAKGKRSARQTRR